MKLNFLVHYTLALTFLQTKSLPASLNQCNAIYSSELTIVRKLHYVFT